MFKSLTIKTAVVVMGAGVLLGMALPQTAVASPYAHRAVPIDQAKNCPSRWIRGNGNFDTSPSMCYPQYANSPNVQRRRSGGCPTGYGVDGEWCTEGHIEHPELNNPNVIAKTGKADRCPAGFHTYMDKCTTDYPRPSKARPKGKGACKAGEVEEWGVWCTSDFDHLSVQDVRSAHYRDWNNIYANLGGGRPTRGPNSEDASEVYKHMFGDDRLDGPVGSANSALVNKRPLTAEQRQILQNANAATAAMLPPEGSEAASSDGASGGSGSNAGEAANSACESIKLRGKLGQLARKAAGC
jgi:hypothetical protein